MGDKPCNGCGLVHPRSEFTERKSGKRKGQIVSKCKKCNTKNAINYRRSRIESGIDVYEKIEWPSKLRCIYGIEPEDYYLMLKNQGGGCAICGSVSSDYKKKKKLAVDHCHSTGVVRGVLCMKCNRAIGLFSDNIEVILRAASYLSKFK